MTRPTTRPTRDACNETLDELRAAVRLNELHRDLGLASMASEWPFLNLRYPLLRLLDLPISRSTPAATRRFPTIITGHQEFAIGLALIDSSYGALVAVSRLWVATNEALKEG